MDADISQSEQWLRFLAWLEDNWRRVAAFASAVVVVGIVVAFVLWKGAEKQRSASEALSLLLVGREPEGTALAGFADSNAGTEAGIRARLLAAGALFAEGKFEESQALFERFMAEQGVGPLTPKAKFGVAACKEAQGQIDAAIGDYKAIVDNPASGSVIPQARFALARLYLEQNQTELARAQYEELAAAQGSSLAGEARIRLSELPPGSTSRQVDVPLAPPSGAVPNQP